MSTQVKILLLLTRLELRGGKLNFCV